ncbi:hypothetical protein [Streptomyces sp. NPDC000229]|uniref:hypothetical protein n=1 Tax=Streptomyces sp. NPDC000229 TaxID=3154247 RepID=UPI0033293868
MFGVAGMLGRPTRKRLLVWLVFGVRPAGGAGKPTANVGKPALSVTAGTLNDMNSEDEQLRRAGTGHAALSRRPLVGFNTRLFDDGGVEVVGGDGGDGW